jgi:hypothetical protein
MMKPQNRGNATIWASIAIVWFKKGRWLIDEAGILEI